MFVLSTHLTFNYSNRTPDLEVPEYIDVTY